MSFRLGYKAFCRNTDSAVASRMAEKYVNDIETNINILERNLNTFKGYQTDSDKLKGDVAEFFASGTFNIKALVGHSPFQTNVDRNHGFASVDITSNFGIKYGLKYYNDGQHSASAQATSFLQSFLNYKSKSGRLDLSFSDYLKERSIPDTVALNDPIYGGQIRIIPADQLKEAISYLKLKIAKESINRPDQVARWQNTLDNLQTKIIAPDGTSSIELTESEAKQIAEIAKNGKFKASDFGISPDELVKLKDIINEGINAGINAAAISMVLKTAPEIYKFVDNLIITGKIDNEQLKEVGFAALNGSTTGMIRGFISASLYTACKTGKFGFALKNVTSYQIAAMTVLFMETMSDSFKVVSGDIPPTQMADNLLRNIIVTAAGIGIGTLFQVKLSFIPGAYLLGNLIGTAIGSFVYDVSNEAIISYCVISGSTFFGLIEQDYALPDEVLSQLGVHIVDPETCGFEETEPELCEPETCGYEEAEPETIFLLRRGVIGFHRIGYI